MEVVYRSFELKMNPKVGLLWPKNKAQTSPKKHQNNFQKVQKSTFLTTKMAKNDPNFRDHLSTFKAENTPKSGPFNTTKNPQTLPKQLQNNFEKVQIRLFRTPKLPKINPKKRQK